MGADDYITKALPAPRTDCANPCGTPKQERAGQAFEVCGLCVDTASGVVTKYGREIFLFRAGIPPAPDIYEQSQNIITRSRLLDELWDAAGEFVNDNTLTVYIKRLREKIENDPANPQIILTVRGTDTDWEEMMLRNREFRQFAILFALMSAASVALGFAISTAAGLLLSFSCAAFGAAFLCLPKSGITASPCSPVKSISCFTMPGGWISVRWMRASFPSCTVKSQNDAAHPGTERCTETG